MMQSFQLDDTLMYPSPSGVSDIPEHSRSFPMKTPEPFPNSETGLSLYESYSPDHSGSPRDIPDPIKTILKFRFHSKQHGTLNRTIIIFARLIDSFLISRRSCSRGSPNAFPRT